MSDAEPSRERGWAADVRAGLSAVEPDAPPQLEIAEQEAEAYGDGQIRSGKLAGRGMWEAIWILSVPVLIQQVLAAFVGLADKMIAGYLPDGVAVPALDGIGIGSYVAWFIGIALTGVGVGAQAIISRAIGAGRVGEAERTAGSALTVGVIWGVAVGAAVWVATEPLIRLCSLEGEAARFCAQYVHVIALSMPACALMTVGSMCLHGAGETAKPAWIGALVNLVNVVFAWLLSGVDFEIFGFHLISPLPIDPTTDGVLGIAVGTAISYFVGAFATMWVLFRGVKDLRPRPAQLRMQGDLVWRICRVGLPNFAEGVALWAVNLFVMAFIGMAALAAAAGTPDVARGGLVGAHMIAVQWEAFSFLPGFAMGTAAASLAGQFIGAGNPDMARRSAVACTWVGVAIMGTLGIALMLLGEPLTRIISREPVHLREVPPILMICGGIQVFFALAMVLRGALRGAGDTTAVLLITVFSSYCIRLPLAWFIGVKLGYGLSGIWFGLCAELVIRGLLFFWRFRSGKWLRVRV